MAGAVQDTSTPYSIAVVVNTTVSDFVPSICEVTVTVSTRSPKLDGVYETVNESEPAAAIGPTVPLVTVAPGALQSYVSATFPVFSTSIVYIAVFPRITVLSASVVEAVTPYVATTLTVTPGKSSMLGKSSAANKELPVNEYPVPGVAGAVKCT